jgi:rhodanese-related sulfurtransferase
VRSVAAADAWRSFERGETDLLDLRTGLERRLYGWPPGVKRVSLTRHILFPRGRDAIYLCQHANRSKLTGRRGAAEVEGGWPGWQAADLPIQRTAPAGGRDSNPGPR